MEKQRRKEGGRGGKKGERRAGKQGRGERNGKERERKERMGGLGQTIRTSWKTSLFQGTIYTYTNSYSFRQAHGHTIVTLAKHEVEV